MGRMKAKAAGIPAHLDNVKANLSFKFLESGENGESTVLDERLVLDPVPEAKKNSSVVLNWLVKVTKQTLLENHQDLNFTLFTGKSGMMLLLIGSNNSHICRLRDSHSLIQQELYTRKSEVLHY